MNSTRTRVARTLMVGATLGMTMGLAFSGLVAVAADNPEPPTAELETPSESSAALSVAPTAEPAIETAPPTTEPQAAETPPSTTEPAPSPTPPETEPAAESVPATADPAVEDTQPVSSESPTPSSVESEGTQARTITAPPTATPSSTTTTVAPPSLNAAAVSVSALAVAPQVFGVSATLGAVDDGSTKSRVVTISWSGTPGAEYEVERRLSTSSTWQWVDSTFDSTSVQDTFYQDWDTFGWYQYRVTPSIYDYDYGYVYGSPGSVSVNVTKVAYPPSLPRSVRVTRTGTTATVTWTAPTTADYQCESTGYWFCGAATSYVVSWAPVGGAWHSVTTTATSRTLSGLVSATTYYVNVRAVNAAGRSAATPSVRIAALARPSVMSPLRAAPAIRQVTLQWNAPPNNGSPITRYLIQRRPAGSATWTYISTATPATATSFTARNLANGTAYYFRIAAVNAVGWGAWNSPTSVRTPTHRLDVNMILVGRELFTAADIIETTAAVAIARTIFARVGIYLVVGTFGLTAAQAGANLTIDNEAEAVDLTADWTIPNRALDLFVVRRMNWSNVVGVSAVDGSCNKNDNSYGRMSGSVASLNESTASTGVIFAHEVGHYLGLDHTYDAGNVMYPVAWPTATGVNQGQGDVMKRHCNVTRL